MGWRSVIRCALLAVAVVLGGCQTEPYTEWRERPISDREAPPPGHAVFAAVQERVDSKLDGGTLPPSPDVTRSSPPRAPVGN